MNQFTPLNQTYLISSLKNQLQYVSMITKLTITVTVVVCIRIMFTKMIFILILFGPIQVAKIINGMILMPLIFYTVGVNFIITNK